MREDGEPITTEQELRELLVRIRNESLVSENSRDFILWVQEILVEHPLLEGEEDGVS